MKWKLDENFGSRTAHLFLRAGYDAETVLQEQLGGSSDETLYAHCIREDRCLLTLDMDFADVLRFPPHHAPGIADLLRFLATEPIRGRLWIVSGANGIRYCRNDPSHAVHRNVISQWMLRRFLFLIPIFAAAQSATNQTSLDRYVHAKDPVYGWKLVDSLKAEGVEADVLELTSQTWRTAKDVDKPVWKHWLTIVRPAQGVKHNKGILFIGAGNNNNPAPEIHFRTRRADRARYGHGCRGTGHGFGSSSPTGAGAS